MIEQSQAMDNRTVEEFRRIKKETGIDVILAYDSSYSILLLALKGRAIKSGDKDLYKRAKILERMNEIKGSSILRDKLDPPIIADIMKENPNGSVDLGDVLKKVVTK